MVLKLIVQWTRKVWFKMSVYAAHRISMTIYLEVCVLICPTARGIGNTQISQRQVVWNLENIVSPICKLAKYK